MELLYEKYRVHVKDEEVLKKIIYDYQLAIDYLKSRHNSLVSSQSFYHSPDSKEIGSYDISHIDRELAEEEVNLSFQKERLKKFTSMHQVLQNIKKDVTQQINDKRSVIEQGVTGLDSLIDLLKMLRDLEFIANQIFDQFLYLEEISEEYIKTIECWNHHLNKCGRNKEGDSLKISEETTNIGPVSEELPQEPTPEISNQDIIKNDSFKFIFESEKNMIFIVIALILLIIYFI